MLRGQVDAVEPGEQRQCGEERNSNDPEPKLASRCGVRCQILAAERQERGGEQ
jgi:hypothetical protein